MAYEDDVLKNLAENSAKHVLFYFESYHGPDQKSQAEYRNKAIEHEQSIWTRDAQEGAKLRMVEYLDSHPKEAGRLKEIVHTVHKIVDNPSMSAGHGHSGPDPAKIMHEQLERLEGGFFGAVVQGVANMIWSNPEEALHKAGLFHTLGEMAMAHGEARLAGHENAEAMAQRFSGEHREESARKAARDDVERHLQETGANAVAGQFPNTIGNMALHRGEHLNKLDQQIGGGKVDDSFQGLHPTLMPGGTAYAAGEIRHPDTPEGKEGGQSGGVGHGEQTQADGKHDPHASAAPAQHGNDGQLAHPGTSVHGPNVHAADTKHDLHAGNAPHAQPDHQQQPGQPSQTDPQLPQGHYDPATHGANFDGGECTPDDPHAGQQLYSGYDPSTGVGHDGHGHGAAQAPTRDKSDNKHPAHGHSGSDNNPAGPLHAQPHHDANQPDTHH